MANKNIQIQDVNGNNLYPKVNLGSKSGLKYDESNNISLNIGSKSGLDIDDNNALKINISTETSSLEINKLNQLDVKLGSGLKSDKNGISVYLSSDFSMDNGNSSKIYISTYFLDKVKEISKANLSTGYNTTSVGTDPYYAYVLQDNESHLGVNLGNGLLWDGISETLTVRLGTGLQIYKQGISVKLGSGLQFNRDNNITVKIGTGLKLSDDGTLYVG